MLRALLIILLAIPAHIFLKAQQSVSQLDSLFSSRYPRQDPGAVILVHYQGKTIFKKSYGRANLESKMPIDTLTNFNIGSLTKQFTAYCILQLAQRRLLALDDLLLRYFPHFNPNLAKRITIRQLLTHSSGIMDHYRYTDTNRVRHAHDKDVLEAVEKLDSTYFEPGTRFRYSNTGYCLLALIIEQVSGLGLGEYFHRNIFIPLGMHRTVLLGDGRPVLHQAIGYGIGSNNKFFRQDMEEGIFFSTEGDGGIYTSLHDYYKWFLAVQAPKGGLDREPVAAATHEQFEINKRLHLYYGFGWFLLQDDGDRLVYHSGSNGGFRAIAYRRPMLDYNVIILSNRGDIDLEELVQEINGILRIKSKSFTNIDALESYMDSWHNFEPCKETTLFSTLYAKSLIANGMALN